ncbi:MAG: hypothetical protein HOQ18_05535 [Dermatophilaceae bacterium]|nr:hypothetical protein [Dermatophilaceae bacterium]
MSNESTTPGPAEQPRPSLPQFDPNVQDTQTLPVAAPTSELPVTPPSRPYAYAGTPAAEGNAPIAGPSVPLAATGLPQRTGAGGTWRQRLGGLFVDRPRTADDGAPSDGGARWSAKKTAVTAGLAIVLASAGAIGAAAAMPAGSTGGDSFRGPGGGRSFQFPGGNGQQLPNLQNGVPGGGLGGIDPNQLSQLDPQDLLNQLNQLNQGGVDPFSDSDGTSSGSDGAKTT